MTLYSQPCHIITLKKVCMRKNKIPPIPDSVWQNPLHFIAFGFGSGAMPVAPGTFGTLMSIPFYLVMQPLSHAVYLAILFMIILASAWICHIVSKDIGIHDHQGMCLDEMPGYFVTMYAAPPGLIWIIIGFLLFRFFDICKPQPIAYIDKNIPGGIGMVLDDVVAGIYSCIILHVIYWII